MADKKKGFVPLYRSIQNHWIWQEETPFDARSAWIDLILSVNHKEEKRKIKGKLITVKPGQMPVSYRFLARRWNWTTDRVLRFLKLLKSDGMIYLDATPTGTLLTLANYRVFALYNTGKSNSDEDSNEDTRKDTDEDTDKDKDNNINNDNNVNNGNNNPQTPTGDSDEEDQEWQ